jgi:hypothetical protein
MYTDIVDLRSFYASTLGRLAERSMSMALTPVWSNMVNERLIGLGYTLPWLDRFSADADRAISFMPAGQGAVNWPQGGPSATALIFDEELPLVDSSVDRILMVHGLDHTPFGTGRPYSRTQLTTLLRETNFTPAAWSEALMFPPSRRRSVMRFSQVLERIGRRWWPIFAGVVIVEAQKRLYQGLPVAARASRRVFVPVLSPQGASRNARQRS